jgi:GNAT superfamily N-acetyltransferase
MHRMRDLFVTPETFHQAVGPFLARGQVLNQVLLGVFEQYRAEPGRYQGEPRLLALQDPVTGEIGLTMQTLPYKAMVSACSEAMGTALGRAFAQRHPDARTVFGKVESARAFSQGAGAAEPQVITRDAVFELRIVLPSAPVPGQARLATPMDAAMLQGWVEAFNTEALPAGWPKDPNAGARMAASGRTWIWMDAEGSPVSMASNPRRVAGWWGIAYVFTLPEHRGHGHAGALVSHVSRLALASGAAGCTLFTDLTNPVSNRVYERIGYRRVGEFTTLQW